MKFTAAWCATLLLLVACSELGLTTPQTTDQKLAYAEGTVTGILQSIPAAVAAGTLSSTKATTVNNMAVAVHQTIQVARAEETSNPSQAIVDLNLATAALTAVQNWLTANGVK